MYDDDSDNGGSGGDDDRIMMEIAHSFTKLYYYTFILSHFYVASTVV